MLRQPDRQPGKYTYAVLVSRLLLFLVFQIIIALVTGSWAKSEKYWLLSATLTNVVSIALLFFLFRREGQNYLSIFRINRSFLRRDIVIFAGIFVVSVPLVFLPFALLIGISIYFRPSLFPYFAILHGLMDFGTALMFLLEIR